MFSGTTNDNWNYTIIRFVWVGQHPYIALLKLVHEGYERKVGKAVKKDI